MLSFEVTAIDLILVIAVIVLLFLHVAKLHNSPEEFIKKSLEKSVKPQNVESKDNIRLDVGIGFGECPRGFGKIRGLGNNDQISDRCLSCYRMSKCYLEEEKIEV